MSPLPEVIASYTAYLHARTHAQSKTTISGDHADINISIGEKTMALAFQRHGRQWSLASAELRHGGQTATFTRGRLTEAVTALLRP